LSLQLYKIQLATSTDKVNLHCFDPTGSLKNLPEDVETQDDRNGQVRFEKRCRVGFSTDRPHSNVELGDENQTVEKDAEIRTVNSCCGSEWEFIKRVSLCNPSMAESDVAKANRAPEIRAR
jgi:hypothetical protein